jgi:hypothetical protein
VVPALASIYTLRAARSTSAAEAGREECEAATRIRAELRPLRAFRAAAESNQLARQVPTIIHRSAYYR